MKFLSKLLKSNKSEIDYEQLYHDSQKKLSWYIDALETKQIQCDTIESIAENLKVENQSLKDKISSIEKSMLDLPKLLGKTLGK
jgi:LPS O-antigen subunit length determinant protein (WzzB/FepE family)